jgi:hypothetical protein
VRRWRGRPLSLSFFAISALGVALTVELYLVGADPRLVSAVYGGVATGGLVYRLMTTWGTSTALVHALGIAVCSLLVVGAVISLQLTGYLPGASDDPGRPVGASWLSAYVRLGCMILALKWPMWQNKHTPPWRD